MGVVAGPRLGELSWTVRLRCTPDAATTIANALAHRPDTFWVQLLSAGTEISCNIQTRMPDESDELVLEKLPRTSRILAVTAHSVLRAFATPGDWAGPRALTDDQVARLRRTPPRLDTGPLALSATDEALLGVLARDGRASYGELAAATGWSESSVRRRLAELTENSALHFLVDVAPRSLGFRAEARLWLSVRPAMLVETAEELARHPEVAFAAASTGPANLIATIACRDGEDLYRYLTERVGTLGGVRTVESAPVIRTVKWAGALLPVQPTTTASAARRASSGGAGRTRRNASAADTHS